MKPVDVHHHLGEAGRTTASARNKEYSPKAAIGLAALLDQAGIATHFGGNYGLALALVAGSVANPTFSAIIIAVLMSLGDEAKGVAFGTGRRCQPAAT